MNFLGDDINVKDLLKKNEIKKPSVWADGFFYLIYNV
jgi:hypothetical protein